MSTRGSNPSRVTLVVLIAALLVVALAAAMALSTPKAAEAARSSARSGQPAFVVQFERQLQVWDRDWTRFSLNLGAQIRLFFTTRNPTVRRDWLAVQVAAQRVRLYLESLWQRLLVWWRQTLPRLQAPAALPAPYRPAQP